MNIMYKKPPVKSTVQMIGVDSLVEKMVFRKLPEDDRVIIQG